MKKIVIIFIFLIINIKFIQANQLFDNYKKYTSLKILSNNQITTFDDEHYFGIKIELAKGWKTYWKNPGDSGAGIQIKVSDENQYIESLKILYPTPKRYYDSDIETIGYENEVVFPVRIDLFDRSKAFELFIDIEYLICKSICIPVEEKRKILFKPNISNQKSTLLSETLNKIPSNETNGYLITDLEKVSDNSFSMKVVTENTDYIKKLNIFIFSDDYKFDHQIRALGKDFILRITSDNEIIDNTEIDVLFSSPLLTEEKILNLKSNPLKVNYLNMILLAFIGGFILNFMPCVLPILSLKIYNFIKIRDQSLNRVIKLSGYTILGITVSFLILSIVTIMIRNLGNEIGWGIQFQNQNFLMIFALILLIFSLNLLGLFNFFLPEKIYKFINFSSKNENLNAFFSGTLATLFATPCSAPFLGTSVGYALTQSSATIIIIFLSLSIGFSVPYIIILIAPKLVKFLPKPGVWMVYLKLTMALLLMLSSLWFFSLTTVKNIYLILFGLIIIITAIYLSTELNLLKKKIIISFIFILSLLTFFYDKDKENKLVWINYNKQEIESMIENSDIVFVDITADWCITCQVNKIRTLNSKEMKNIFEKEKIKLVRGDWTNRNSEILEFISSYKKFGIPFNIIYGPSNKRGIILPELLSKDNIKKSIKLVR